nr:hypothetical protein [Cypionkella aquatica]
MEISKAQAPNLRSELFGRDEGEDKVDAKGYGDDQAQNGFKHRALTPA